MKIIAYFLFILVVLLSGNSCEELGKLTNRDPVIKKISAEPDTIAVGGTVFLTVEASDPDNDEFTVQWASSAGYFTSSSGATVQWVALVREGIFTIEVTVTDVNKGEATENIKIAVVSENVPFVKIMEPIDGAYIVGQGFLDIIANVSPVSFIDRVEFYINGELLATDKHVPYMYNMDLKDISGPLKIKCIAYRIGLGDIKGSDEIEINVQAVVPIPL